MMPRGRPKLDKPGKCAVHIRHADGRTAGALKDLAARRKVTQAAVLESAIRDYIFAQAAAGDRAAAKIKSFYYEKPSDSRSLDELRAALQQHLAGQRARQERRRTPKAAAPASTT